MSTKKKPEKDALKKNPAAVALGRLGGLIGGPARAKALSANQRSVIATKAGEAKRDGRASGAGNFIGMAKKTSAAKRSAKKK